MCPSQTKNEKYSKKRSGISLQEDVYELVETRDKPPRSTIHETIIRECLFKKTKNEKKM